MYDIIRYSRFGQDETNIVRFDTNEETTNCIKLLLVDRCALCRVKVDRVAVVECEEMKN